MTIFTHNWNDCADCQQPVAPNKENIYGDSILCVDCAPKCGHEDRRCFELAHPQSEGAPALCAHHELELAIAEGFDPEYIAEWKKLSDELTASNERNYPHMKKRIA